MKAAIIQYTNHRGERAQRRILPMRMEYGATEWHPQPQWLLWAWDLDKDAERAFAMAGIQAWGEPPNTTLSPQCLYCAAPVSVQTDRAYTHGQEKGIEIERRAYQCGLILSVDGNGVINQHEPCRAVLR